MVQINGESKDAANKNLYQYLVDEGFDISRVVVELNLEIIPAEDLKNITIKDNDSIEVLRFVGGG
ncbi:MAG: sulfur carrier protein ThiS [Clostridia bacterium]|nr:sulfur carrier protein ThiS [Clostridia bacterium]